MEIKVYGPGCVKCTEAEKLVMDVVSAKGGNIKVQKVSDLKEMMAVGIMSTPAVAVNGVIKSTGKVPSKEDIAAWIDGAAGSAPADVPSNGGCCCGGKC